MGNSLLFERRSVGNGICRIVALSTILYCTVLGINAIDSSRCDDNAVVNCTEVGVPTIVPGRCGDIPTRAMELHDEIPRIGQHEKLAAMFASCTREDIEKVHRECKLRFAEDSLQLLKEKYSAVTVELINARSVSLPRALAGRYYAAVQGYDYEFLVQYLRLLDNNSTNEMLTASEQMYGAVVREIVEQLQSDLRGDRMPRIVKCQLSVLSGARRLCAITDAKGASDDAKKIIEDRKTRVWMDEYITSDNFHNILMSSSFEHLRRVSKCFRDLTGLSLFQVIIDEHYRWSGRWEYSALVQYAEDKYGYFAKLLNDALTRFWGVDTATLNLIIPWRAEIDLVDIKAAYLKTYGLSLYEHVGDRTSYEYKDLLLALIGK